MKLSPSVLSLALLAAMVAPAAHAEIAIDSIADSEVSFEGLIQADAYWYNNDLSNLDGQTGDGVDHDFGLRRAELVLKGKGPGNVEYYHDWSVRWLHAERDLSRTKTEQITALEGHLNRMKLWKERLDDSVKEGAAATHEASAAEFFRLEADDWLFAVTAAVN